ncbi:MAG: FHA domain-containing protein [Gemmataceae bacterium]
MLLCPLCQFLNPPGTFECLRCCKHSFDADPESGRFDMDDLPQTRTIVGPLTIPIRSMGGPTDTPRTIAPPKAAPRLRVIQGEKPDLEYPLHRGGNIIGRAADGPNDIDLTTQEPPDQVWTSRQHACCTLDDRGTLILEDLNSLNGTFVNRVKLHAGQRRVLADGDLIAMGRIQLQVILPQ